MNRARAAATAARLAEERLEARWRLYLAVRMAVPPRARVLVEDRERIEGGWHVRVRDGDRLATAEVAVPCDDLKCDAVARMVAAAL